MGTIIFRLVATLTIHKLATFIPFTTGRERKHKFMATVGFELKNVETTPLMF
jgi:hypothetical protein